MLNKEKQKEENGFVVPDGVVPIVEVVDPKDIASDFWKVAMVPDLVPLGGTLPGTFLTVDPATVADDRTTATITVRPTTMGLAFASADSITVANAVSGRWAPAASWTLNADSTVATGTLTLREVEAVEAIVVRARLRPAGVAASVGGSAQGTFTVTRNRGPEPPPGVRIDRDRFMSGPSPTSVTVVFTANDGYVIDGGRVAIEGVTPGVAYTTASSGFGRTARGTLAFPANYTGAVSFVVPIRLASTESAPVIPWRIAVVVTALPELPEPPEPPDLSDVFGRIQAALDRQLPTKLQAMLPEAGLPGMLELFGAVPLVPLTPTLADETGRALARPAVPIDLSGVGLRADAALTVEWSAQATDRSPVHLLGAGSPGAGSGPADLRSMAPSLRIVPTTSYNPLRGSRPEGGQLRFVARVTATLSALGRTFTSSTELRTVPVPVPSLPVPTVFALYRCPNMETTFPSFCIPPFHDNGRAENGAVALAVPGLGGTGRAVLGLDGGSMPLPGLLGRDIVNRIGVPAPFSALGALGRVLGLACGPVSLPNGATAGLATLPPAWAFGGLPPDVRRAVAPLVAYVEAATLLARTVGAIVSHEARVRQQLVCVLDGAAVCGANIAFIWPGTGTKNIEDETESAVVLGRPGTSVSAYIRHDWNPANGYAVFRTGSGYACVIPNFQKVGPRPGTMTGGLPDGRNEWDARSDGFLGAVEVVGGDVSGSDEPRLRNDRSFASVADAGDRDSLARTISSWRIAEVP